MARLRKEAEGKGLTSYVPGEAMCYAARADSFVVRANGRLNKCTLALEHPANQVGRLHEDGSVEVSGESMLPWMRGVFTGNSTELECPMVGLAEPRVGGGRSVDIQLMPSAMRTAGAAQGAIQ